MLLVSFLKPHPYISGNRLQGLRRWIGRMHKCDNLPPKGTESYTGGALFEQKQNGLQEFMSQCMAQSPPGVVCSPWWGSWPSCGTPRIWPSSCTPEPAWSAAGSWTAWLLGQIRAPQHAPPSWKGRVSFWKYLLHFNSGILTSSFLFFPYFAIQPMKSIIWKMFFGVFSKYWALFKMMANNIEQNRTGSVLMGHLFPFSFGGIILFLTSKLCRTPDLFLRPLLFFLSDLIQLHSFENIYKMVTPNLHCQPWHFPEF